ncbi:glycosyltransferase family 2 protein [Ralstonia sp. 25C]|uniref:glycosyltransferase family 2 protein n=1 Tax=Ralstonia sp. 25C TaxID=3447363 RepID=UPI003F75316D
MDELVDRLVGQVHRIVVVDNASRCAPDFSRHSASARIEVIGAEANVGIAAAHNIGLRRLGELGCSYGLLMDHDSLPLPHMVGRLLATDLALRARGELVAAVGPVTIDRRTGVRSKFVKMRNGVVSRVECAPGHGFVEADFLISSGTLLRLDILSAIGGMNESYFIDHVDTEWCLRAKNAGYRIFGVCDALLDHSLGDRVVRIWFGRMREVPVHSPFRNYYMFRNTVLMLRTVPMPFGWKCAHLFRLLQFLVFFVLSIGPRSERARLMFKGLWHGLIGHTGRL